MNYTDQQLSAFLDGELESGEASALRQLLAIDLDLSGRLEELATADSLIRLEYEKIDAKPLPQSLIDLLAEPSSTLERDSNVVRLKFASTTIEVNTRNIQRFAATFLFAAIGALFLMQNKVSNVDPLLASGPVPFDSELHQMLRDTPSATPYQRSSDAGSDSQFNVVLSFKNHLGQYCREFQLQVDGVSERSAACLENDQWSVLIVAMEETGTDNGEYATASSVNQQAFESYMDSIVAQPPLSLEEELKAIKNGWKN